jgi:membrane protease YdiL (CAAX protease family)
MTMVLINHRLSPTRFFVLTFLLSWAIWIPLDLAHFDLAGVRIDEGASGTIRLLGVLMPALAALVLTGLDGGRGGVSRLLDRLAIWRVSWWWWAAAVAPSLLLVAAAGVVSLADPTRAVAPLAPQPLAGLLINVVFLALATLGEEIGWRGVALPALQARSSALAASAVLGVVWAAWHLPFWLLLDTFKQFGVTYLIMNGLLIFPTTFYITWVFNHTRGSLLLPVAIHVLFNIINVAWLPVTLHLGAFWLLIAAEWVIALGLLRHLEPPVGAQAT